ncbi:MAG: alpha/beta hydrolase [Verrucomicrobiota bacterium]
MKLRHLLLTLFSLLTCLAFAAEEEPGKVYVYKQSGSKPQEMEIYFPPNWEPAKNKVPGLIMFHGGGWGGGTLSQFRYACRYFATRGIVTATVTYQLAVKKDASPGQSRKRVCITDAKSAIRWMKQHAGELGIDPARIITGGGSAGGHICMLATNNPGLNDPADPKDIDTSVVAYLLFNPAFTADDAPDAEVDVLKHLTAKLPPAIMFFGTNDPWKKGSDAALKHLKELGNTTTELWLAEGQAHSFFNRAPWQNLTISEADRFLVRLGLLSGGPSLPAAPKGEKISKAP